MTENQYKKRNLLKRLELKKPEVYTMHQESNCVHGMIEKWYDAQRMKNLEHDQCFLDSNAF